MLILNKGTLSQLKHEAWGFRLVLFWCSGEAGVWKYGLLLVGVTGREGEEVATPDDVIPTMLMHLGVTFSVGGHWTVKKRLNWGFVAIIALLDSVHGLWIILYCSLLHSCVLNCGFKQEVHMKQHLCVSSERIFTSLYSYSAASHACLTSFQESSGAF